MLLHIQSLKRNVQKEPSAARVAERLEKAAGAGLRLESLINKPLDVLPMTAQGHA